MPLRCKNPFERRVLKLTDSLEKIQSRGKIINSISRTPTGKKVVHIVTKQLYDRLLLSFKEEITFGELLAQNYPYESIEKYDAWVADLKNRLKPEEIEQLKKDLGFLKAKILQVLKDTRTNFGVKNIKTDLLANALNSIYSHFDLLDMDL